MFRQRRLVKMKVKRNFLYLRDTHKQFLSSSMGTQNFFFVSRSWQHEKHLPSYLLYYLNNRSMETNNIPSTGSDLQQASLSSICWVEQDVNFFLKLSTSLCENFVQFRPWLSSKEEKTGSEYGRTISFIFPSKNLWSPPISLPAIDEATAKVEGEKLLSVDYQRPVTHNFNVFMTPFLFSKHLKENPVRFYFFYLTRYLHKAVFDLFTALFGQFIIDIFINNQA